MLISKIKESLIKINPNINLTILNSSINNSFINQEQKKENNFQFGYILHSNNNTIQDNSLVSDKNEGINPLNGPELLIIPESPEFDLESSSENSNSSNDSKSKSNEEKKKIELYISENNNFSFNTIYDNLNTISNGNYSKDINLQKSVKKLIDVYLKEKLKSIFKSSYSKNEISDNNSIIIKKKEKEKGKERDKKKYIGNKNIKVNII